MEKAIETINKAEYPLIVQAENPDGDSLASALALEQLLGDAGQEPALYCSVDIPRYLRYMPGWDRVSSDLPKQFDLVIVVDTSSTSLLERFLNDHASIIKDKPFIVIDHHSSETDLPEGTINVIEPAAVSTGEVIFNMAKNAGWKLSALGAEFIASSILSDSLGLTSPKTTADSIRVLAECVELGADLTRLDEARRKLNKKSYEIFKYKGRLFERVELALDGQLAIIHIPWEEIEEYSDAYNPSMLVIDEMRFIEGVKLAAAFKTYPDGKITVKLRANPEARFMDKLAGHFGGGGHPFAAGFKVYDVLFDALKTELVSVTNDMLEAS